MSTRAKLLAGLILIVGLLSGLPNGAEAHWRRHGWHGGYGWGPAIGLGIGVGSGWGWGYPYGYYAPRPYYRPYPYYRSYYYAPPPRCGYVRTRVWRHGYWVVRRAWRCW